MAGITLAQAQAQLDAYLAAATKIAAGQEYEIDTGSGGRRRLRRADLREVRSMIEFWDAKVKDLTPSPSGGRTTYLVPRHGE